MTRARRQTIAKIIALGASLCIGVLLAEAGLRITGRDSARLWAPDGIVGWRPIPDARRHWTEEGDGLVQINSHGFRDLERRVEADPGVERVAVFGDSQTEADQVNLPQTYSSVLEASLRGQGALVDVLNFGVTGYSPIQELLLFRQEAAQYRPRVVVLGLFLDNDVSGCLPGLSVAPDAPFAKVDGENLTFDYSRAEASAASYRREPFFLLRKYSAIYRVASTVREQLHQTKPSDEVGQATVPKRFEVYERTPRPEWETAWVTLEAVLSAFDREARALGAAFVVVSIPAAQVVDHRAWKRLVEDRPAMQTVDWDLTGPERRLRAFGEAHHINLIQPYQTFEATVVREPLFFGDVGHMTPQGHELIAGELNRYLTANRLLTPPADAAVQPRAKSVITQR